MIQLTKKQRKKESRKNSDCLDFPKWLVGAVVRKKKRRKKPPMSILEQSRDRTSRPPPTFTMPNASCNTWNMAALAWLKYRLCSTSSFETEGKKSRFFFNKVSNVCHNGTVIYCYHFGRLPTTQKRKAFM